MTANNIKVILSWSLVLLKCLLVIMILPLVIIMKKSGAID